MSSFLPKIALVLSITLIVVGSVAEFMMAIGEPISSNPEIAGIWALLFLFVLIIGVALFCLAVHIED
jgi:hypothetical protein